MFPERCQPTNLKVSYYNNVRVRVTVLHCTSDDSISEFQFRHDIDMTLTILTIYRDIDTILIFCKCIRYTSALTVTRHEQGSMLYLDNQNVCLSVCLKTDA